MSSRRKISLLLYKEWIISFSSCLTSAWKPSVSRVWFSAIFKSPGTACSNGGRAARFSRARGAARLAFDRDAIVISARHEISQRRNTMRYPRSLAQAAVLCRCRCSARWRAAAPTAQVLTIVTSFPKDLTEVYKQAFEQRNPGVKVEIQNKGTSAGVAYVREAPASNKPDIFWASAPDAFEVLAKDKLLQKYEGRNPAVPAKIGTYPINDPEGLLLRPGARRLRPHVEHALHEGEQAAGAPRMGRPHEARLLRPRRDVVAVALGHDPPDGRNHPAGRRLGQRLVADAEDRRQQRGHHRAQLRRARRRQQRPVRNRARDRFLRTVGESVGLPGRISSIRR